MVRQMPLLPLQMQPSPTYLIVPIFQSAKMLTHDQMKEAIEIIDGRAEVEVSGNVTKENLEKLVDLGVDYVSSGALTHSSPIMDISLKNLHTV